MAAQQRQEDQEARLAPAASLENSFPELKLQPDFQPSPVDRYHINDLLRYHDRVFVQAAYRAILKRPPDEAEFLRDLKKLQSGHANKIDLLAALRYSTEGKAKQVRLEGLTVPALIRRLGQLPIAGYGVRLIIALLRLPHSIRDQREFGGYVLSQNQQIADFINAVSARVAAARDGVSRFEEALSTLTAELQTTRRRQEEFEQFTRPRLDELDQQLRASIAYSQRQLAALTSQLDDRITTEKQELLARMDLEATERRVELERLVSEQQQLLATTQSELHTEIAQLYLKLQHAREELAILGQSVDHAPRPKEAPPPGAVNLDALYVALEDRFRGTREEIKEQCKTYLPWVKEAAPVLDLGCGRGEWLEVLRDEGIEARGVDNNRIQIARCRALELNVSEDDLLAYLRNAAAGSVGAITGFHIVEHLSLDRLVALLNEVMRVLRPGGLAIFETPNPDNVLVGSNFFYMDPTHRHPLPSELMEFLLESRGFDGIEVLNLHPWESGRIGGDSEVANRFNDYFYGPMDYAIVARKVET